MLTELIPSHERLIAEVCDEWVSHGLSCEPADRERAERGVDVAYLAAGLEPPRFHFWFDSPQAGAQGMSSICEVSESVIRQVYYQIRKQVEGEVASQVSLEVTDQIDAQIANKFVGQANAPFQRRNGNLEIPFVNQLRRKIYNASNAIRFQSLRLERKRREDQERRQVFSLPGGAIAKPHAGGISFREHSQSVIRGAQDTYLLTRMDIFRRLGVKNLEIADGLLEVGRSEGWWWPLRDAVILTDRPELLLFDQDNRLHCETGPALRYRDGFIIYSWHGITVPPDLIERGWDAKRIFKERNVEIRRCAIERIGWDKFVEDANLTQVGESVPDPGNLGQELSLFDVPETIFREPVRVLLCTNGTPERDGSRRRFGLTVPADIPDPLAAAAWTYDVSPEKYAHTARRA